MNIIHSLQADAVYAESLIAYYERALQEIRSAAQGYLASDGPDAYHMQNIASRCEQAPMFGQGQAQEDRYAFTGPAIATGGCPYVSRKTCSHEPSLRPNNYHCPVCAYDLTGPWNDTDAKAAARMFEHWASEHRGK